MTVEEKRNVLRAWCESRTEDCSTCVLNDTVGGNCYTDVDSDTVLRNYNMVFCSDSEQVTHPAHYAYSKYEPVKVIREWGLNFNLGNVVKYIARAGRKDDILQDLKKARQYIDFEIEALENET